MKEPPTIIAWDNHQEAVDEIAFTPWADEGRWLAWNGQSPEVEVVLFVASLVMMMRPALTIETGVGQGYMTRAIVEMLNEDERLIAYESDDGWRQAMWSLPFWTKNSERVTLSTYRSPGPWILAEADLCVFDSDWEIRFGEIDFWQKYAKPGAVALIHDTAEQPETIHLTLHERIRELGMTGFPLRNPRGCFVAVKG